MRKILIGIVVLSFIGCTQQEMTKEYWDNGNLKSEGFLNDTTKTGSWKYYDDGIDGRLISEGNYKEGEKDGLWKDYDYDENVENDIVVWEGTYKNGYPEGVVKEYWDNGKISIETTWKDGQQNGSQTFYYRNGQIEQSGNYKDNLLVGIWKTYHEENGNLKWIEEMDENGKQISHECFDLNENKIECPVY